MYVSSIYLDNVKCDEAKPPRTPLVVDNQVDLLDSAVAREVAFQVTAASGVAEIQEKMVIPCSDKNDFVTREDTAILSTDEKK